MIRNIVTIDEDKCNGCGLCADACHEGAIGMVNGKAKLLREDYCDGLGDCLPACPMNAISIEKREAPAYDEKAVKEAQASKTASSCGCPSGSSKMIMHETASGDLAPAVSQLRQWPVQIQLVPVNAPYFDGADLLVAADCTAYAYGSFHHDFMKDKITLIGCPKLDSVNYAEKLAQIISSHDIKSITVVRMQVPCCGGLSHAVTLALQTSGKEIPLEIVTVSTDGEIVK
ncbi:MAG: ATP-binding protein [Lachnospiraceae bacterium]|jgi:NAD-dependent dihydropyrimidine dehydrogenase PreA subunit